ncbi:MAG TPA: FGGY-family carbohydrate kinase, partial [Bacteroidota bacterium]|nr:FGGY-family carbohydrate kinase [Bacteroidota bacterium]
QKMVRGICGQVDGSIIPGMMGLEAGQSAFGDVYAWFRDVLLWPLEHVVAKSDLIDEEKKKQLIEWAADEMIAALSKDAAKLSVDESGILALDWMNGRRTPDANQLLKGAITGLTLASDAPKIFRALVESTAFGARKIVERFRSEGVRIEGVIAIGGVAKKSPFIMQVVADVLNMPIRVPRSEQTCALGAAMFAAVAAGLYKSVEDAKRSMGSGLDREYRPDAGRARRYDELYDRYSNLGEFVEHEIQSRRNKG